ncbi:MAG: hypothetical protein KDC75_26480, partial [Phaeodactylibacter sp.]|nr:hypothetical protein [Phaeodactylibacter sp.]
VDLQNPHRLIRALAVCRAAGRPFSSFRSQEKAERLFTPIYLQLHRPRPELYARIDSRVKQMMERGLAEEARRLYPQRHHTALQTVGYQELFAHFDGLCSLEEAVALIQRNSRRYAKRQLTWYRRDGHWKLLRPDDGPLALEYIEAARNKGWRLQYSDERPEGFPFHPIAKVPGQYLQMLQREKPIAALYRAEHRQAVVIQGPFPAGGPAEALAMQLLLHEALLPGEGLPAYAIANPLHLHLPAGFRQEATSLELLPGWAQAAAGALLEALPGLGAVKVTEAG